MKYDIPYLKILHISSKKRYEIFSPFGISYIIYHRDPGPEGVGDEEAEP
jgi:hypothetical protein